MKALTIHQPWASLILLGIKRYENRTWRTNYRGPLAIHAGSSRASWDIAEADPAIAADLEQHGLNRQTAPHGVILGAVWLADCIGINLIPADAQSDPYASGPWCWVLASPTMLQKSLDCSGKLGLWTPQASSRSQMAKSVSCLEVAVKDTWLATPADSCSQVMRQS
ncbi:MAG: ASCH domain-containing protein [Pseudomonadota bacterium]